MNCRIGSYRNYLFDISEKLAFMMYIFVIFFLHSGSILVGLCLPYWFYGLSRIGHPTCVVQSYSVMGFPKPETYTLQCEWGQCRDTLEQMDDFYVHLDQHFWSYVSSVPVEGIFILLSKL